MTEQTSYKSFLGDASNDALQQLVKRFGSSRVTLLGRKAVRRRLTAMAAERGLEITQDRER
ncbi:MAG: hypothetical protein OES69_11015 [Myxococcales bacterium]|nr:hypothetical protein [Myxococcales bacterium]